MNTGIIIRDIRLSANLTQNELAAKMGVHPSTVSNLETNRTEFGYGSLRRFCIAMKMPFSFFIEKAEKQKSIEKYADKYKLPTTSNKVKGKSKALM